MGEKTVRRAGKPLCHKEINMPTESNLTSVGRLLTEHLLRCLVLKALDLFSQMKKIFKAQMTSKTNTY